MNHDNTILGGSSHLVSGLVHPSYKWINPTYPIYNWGYNPLKLAVGSSPPSRESHNPSLLKTCPTSPNAMHRKRALRVMLGLFFNKAPVMLSTMNQSYLQLFAPT